MAQPGKSYNYSSLYENGTLLKLLNLLLLIDRIYLQFSP